MGVILISAEKTSADLIAEKKQANNSISATTLSFVSLNTVNFDPMRWFINIDGIKLNGYEIKSLKIKNEGHLDFNYSIKTNKKSSDDLLCEALTLRIMKDWEKVYEGSLIDLKVSQKISSDRDDDLVFIVSLKKNDKSFVEKQCNFDFEFKTWKNSPDEDEKGLFAKQVLSNTIKTGRW